jgi:threonyl-tRNA synthetase
MDIYEMLKASGFRVESDLREEKLGYKIREVQTLKIPYSLVLGDKEKDEGLVTYRKYGSQEQVTVSIEQFLELLMKETKNN